MAFVYSCCFYFSLRMGGILIGILSLFQATVILICFCYGYTRLQQVKDEITHWANNLNLIFVRGYVEEFKEEPAKYIMFEITLTCIYMFASLLFIYGAYACNNMLMFCYILLELLRLILLTILVVTGLLLVKQNAMDIGILIGASVVSGFLLLGMFYLWVCAANLPVLINEMERDKQADAIAHLQRMLETTTQRINMRILDSASFAGESGKNMFTITRNRIRNANMVIPSRVTAMN